MYVSLSYPSLIPFMVEKENFSANEMGHSYDKVDVTIISLKI